MTPEAIRQKKLLLEKENKYIQMGIVQEQMVLLQSEINLREGLLKEWRGKLFKLRDDAQLIADDLLGIEYESLKDTNL